MKRFGRAMLGVTLLEILLVLAIAAMIIVMSVRYYQSATSSQQANSTMQQIQAITAAADGLAQSTGSYSAGGVTTPTVQALVPQNSMTTPWGTSITVPTATATTYTVTIPAVPSAVCPLIVSKLQANNHYATTATCTASAPTDVTYTYTANP